MPAGSASSPLRLSALFEPVPTSVWQAVVAHDLKGQDYEKRLVWRTDEGIAVQPFHRAEDVAPLGVERLPEPGVAPHVRGSGRAWQITDTPSWPPDAVRADRLHEAGANAVQELGWAMAEAVERLAAAIDAGQTLADAARSTSFVFAVGSTYFVEIAKVRAGRHLWAQVLDAFTPGATGTATVSEPLRLHLRTARANKSPYDPYTNLLRVTTEAMSAVIGGADTVLVEAHGFDPHLAVNVQRVLAHESHLDAVADPAGGSYFVETLTDALAGGAWDLLQSIEAAGGYAAAVRAGMRDEHLQASRAARETAVATRRRVLVGVNDYPDLDAKPAPAPEPAGDDEADLAAMRLAAPFEAVRARTTRHAARIGRTPVVHLVTRGDVRMRVARANFCLNLFGCAGLAITQGPDLAADADLVVLCSADDAYASLAREIVPIATAPVLVAANPKHLADALSPTGVQGFVYAGCNVLETLTLWQDRLGMAP